MVEARSVAPQRLPWLRNRRRCSSLVQLLLNSGILKAFSFLWRLLFYAKVVVATHSRCVTWLSNVWLWTDYCVATFSCLLCKRHLHISQNALYLPPKFCITFFFFSPEYYSRPEYYNAYAKFWVANKVYYGRYLQVTYNLWFNCTLGLNSFLLCFGMVMYVNGFEQRKIKFKPRVKLYHKIYIHLVILAFQSINLIGSLPWVILHKDYYSFKIFLSFWLAQIPRLFVMQNQKCSKSCKGSIGPEREGNWMSE